MSINLEQQSTVAPTTVPQEGQVRTEEGQVASEEHDDSTNTSNRLQNSFAKIMRSGIARRDA